MRWAIVVFNANGELLKCYNSFENINDEALVAIITSVKDKAILEGFTLVGNLAIYGKKVGNLPVFLAIQSSMKHRDVVSRLFFEEIKYIMSPDEIAEKARGFMSLKLPDITEIIATLENLVNKALENDMVKYSLELRGYGYYTTYGTQLRAIKVINFSDGFKRAVISAYNGDFVTAYNLMLGALEFKKDPLAQLFAVYIGFILASAPSVYPAPSISELKDMLNNVKPSSDIETVLKNFENALLESFGSYKRFLDAINILKSNLDVLFDALSSEAYDQVVKDALVFILITYEPSILSSQKINFLIDYVGNRSFFLGHYLKATINRLRTWQITIAIDIPWKDVVGNIRRLKTQFINSKVDLKEVIEKYELDANIKKVRDNIIGTFMNMTEYLKIIYWSLLQPKASIEDLREFLPEVLLDSHEVFKFLIDALPPVNMEMVIDSAYLFSLVAYLSRGFCEDSTDFLRQAYSVDQSVAELVSLNIKENRLSSAGLLKALSLSWISHVLSIILEEIPPFTLKALSDILPFLKEIANDLKGENIERYLLASYLLRTITLCIIDFLDMGDKPLYETAVELINDYISFLKAGASIPILLTTLIDILSLVIPKISDPELKDNLSSKIIFLKEIMEGETLSPIVKNILEER